MLRKKWIHPSLFLFLPILSGCILNSDDNKGRGGVPLPIGHYFILNDLDFSHRYTQYFVITSASHWEFVEYGFDRTTDQVCQVTRQRGSYSVSADTSTLTMNISHRGESTQSCISTKAQFDAYAWEPAGAVEPLITPIHAITDSSFTADNIFPELPTTHTYVLIEPEVDFFF